MHISTCLMHTKQSWVNHFLSISCTFQFILYPILTSKLLKSWKNEKYFFTDETFPALLIFFIALFSFAFFLSLSLSVPPERISIRDESNSERNSVVGPYSEGDTMKLKCDVFGGRPTPNVTWYRDGYPLSSETVVVPSGRHLRSEIVLERLSRQDLNSRFTCKAINHHRATPVEVSVQLDMNCK